MQSYSKHSAGPELDFWLASGDGHRLLLDVSGERRSNRQSGSRSQDGAY